MRSQNVVYSFKIWSKVSPNLFTSIWILDQITLFLSLQIVFHWIWMYPNKSRCVSIPVFVFPHCVYHQQPTGISKACDIRPRYLTTMRNELWYTLLRHSDAITTWKTWGAQMLSITDWPLLQYRSNLPCFQPVWHCLVTQRATVTLNPQSSELIFTQWILNR